MRSASHFPSARGPRASSLAPASTSYACPCPQSRKLRVRAGALSPSTVRPFSCFMLLLSPEADWIPDITQRPVSRASSRGSNAPSHDISLSSQVHGARTIPLLSPHHPPQLQLGASSRATSCSRQRSSPVCFSPFSCSFPSCSSASPHSRASSRPYALLRPRATVRTRKRISEG